MRKQKFITRLLASVVFLALLLFSVYLFFGAFSRMIFVNKYAEEMGISQSAYASLIKDILSYRVQNNLTGESAQTNPETSESVNDYIRGALETASAVDLNGSYTVQAINEMIQRTRAYTDSRFSCDILRYRVPVMLAAIVMAVVGIALLARVGEISRHYLLAFLAVVWLIPIAWLILCAFGTDKGPNIRSFFPKSYTLNNFKQILGTTDSVSQYPKWFLNSFTIACFNCVISSCFVLMVAYSMSCMRFKARKPLMNVAIILNLFPGFLSMIAVYFVMKSLGMTNSNIGLILVYSAGSGLGYLVAKGFFDTVPKSLREAAKIEGASESQVFVRIVVPLSKPIIVYTVIGAFLSPWMDFIFANIMLNSGISEDKTVAIGLYAMINKVNINEYFARFCAGGVLVSIPISILFIIMQKFYIEGVTGGSVKG